VICRPVFESLPDKLESPEVYTASPSVVEVFLLVLEVHELGQRRFLLIGQIII
jgi:hypothetical protein